MSSMSAHTNSRIQHRAGLEELKYVDPNGSFVTW